MESNVRVLILGASYGSLLAIKLLLAGHTVKLICLPAEAELINRRHPGAHAGEGARRPGRDRLAQAAGQTVRRRPGRRRSVRLRSRRARDAGAAVPLGRRARAARRGGQGEGAVHVDHEHAAAALTSRASRASTSTACRALLHRRERLGRLRSALHDAVQPGPAGVPPAGRKSQRAAGQAADQLQGGALRVADAHTAMLRRLAGGHRGRAVRHRSRQHRAARQAPGARLDLRAAREMGDAARRQLSLRAAGRRAQHQGGGAWRYRASRSVYDWVVEVCMSLGAAESDLVPFEKYASAALSLQSPSSAARALAAGAPNIERTDRLVQTIAAQKGMRQRCRRPDRGDWSTHGSSKQSPEGAPDGPRTCRCPLTTRMCSAARSRRARRRPRTGFYRDGCCNTGPRGCRPACRVRAGDAPSFSTSRASRATTSSPRCRSIGFPGLVPGDRWCVCAATWRQALRRASRRR